MLACKEKRSKCKSIRDLLQPRIHYRQSRAVCRSGSSQSLTKLSMVLPDCRELSSCELGSERLPTPDWAEDRASKTNRMQWLREKRTRRAIDPRYGYSLYSRSDPERGLLKRAAG